MQHEKFFIIWQSVETKAVSISEFATKNEAEAFCKLINFMPSQRTFITMLKGSKVYAKLEFQENAQDIDDSPA